MAIKANKNSDFLILVLFNKLLVNTVLIINHIDIFETAHKTFTILVSLVSEKITQFR